MITNACLTIYHRRVNQQTGLHEYVRRFIPHIHWYTDQKVHAGEGGIKSADVYKIRIPDTELTDYVSPGEYARLSSDSQNYYWTVENKDLFVKGRCDLNTIKSVSDLEKQNLIYGSVDSWSDNRFGGLPHIRIGGSV